VQNHSLRKTSSQGIKSAVILTPDRQIDRRILLQADSLERHGWNVTILAMGLDSPATKEEPWVLRVGERAATNHKVKINRFLLSYQFLRKSLPNNNAFVKYAKSLIAKHIIDWEKFYLNIFFDAASQFSPNVFIAADLPMLAVARKAAQRCGAKLIYDSHELYTEQGFSERERQQWISIEKKHIHACDAVITVNDSIARILEKTYTLQKVEVILNATKVEGRTPVKTAIFHDAFQLSKDRKILLFQGALFPGRNLDALIEAMHYVKDRSIALIILGDGPVKSGLLNYARANRLEDRVYFHAAVPQDRLPYYTEAADGGIIPYQGFCLNNYYCTPNKLFEFISAALPILATDLPEIAKFVQSNKIGIVGNMESPIKIAALIDSFFSAPTTLREWRQNLMRVRQEISWEREEEKFIKIINNV